QMNRDVVRAVSIEDQEVERLAGGGPRGAGASADNFHLRAASRHRLEKAGLRAYAHELRIDLVDTPVFAGRAAARQGSNAEADESDTGKPSALSCARGVDRLLKWSALIVVGELFRATGDG